MNKKLYVGNLSYTVTSDQLKDHFSQAGAVIDSVVIIDNRSGRSKGFGFVEFEKEEDAAKAITLFAGKDFQGRNLVVNEARPKVEDGAPAAPRVEETVSVEAPKEEKPEEVAADEPVEEVKEDK